MDGDTSFEGLLQNEIIFDELTLFVIIPNWMGEEALRSIFSQHGTVISVFRSSPPKHYAFVKFSEAGEAQAAMRKLDNLEPLYLKIRKKEAKRKNPASKYVDKPGLSLPKEDQVKTFQQKLEFFAEQLCLDSDDKRAQGIAHLVSKMDLTMFQKSTSQQSNVPDADIDLSDMPCLTGKWCAVCKQLAEYHCYQCERVYCSEVCQAADWRTGHFVYCKPSAL